MKKIDPNLVAAGLSQLNTGPVPSIDILNDPAAVALVGMQPKAVVEGEENLTEGEREELRRKE